MQYLFLLQRGNLREEKDRRKRYLRLGEDRQAPGPWYLVSRQLPREYRRYIGGARLFTLFFTGHVGLDRGSTIEAGVRAGKCQPQRSKTTDPQILVQKTQRAMLLKIKNRILIMI